MVSGSSFESINMALPEAASPGAKPHRARQGYAAGKRIARIVGGLR